MNVVQKFMAFSTCFQIILLFINDLLKYEPDK